MKRRLTVLFILLLLMAVITTSVSAQEYSFSVPKMTVHVFLNEDGKIGVEYLIVFQNNSAGHVIDFVDIGMPNNGYDWSSISADVNGNPLNISSDYQGDGGYGFAVDMGPYAIQPGQTGQVHVVVGSIDGMFYPDSDDENYASSEFSPTWFGSQYVYGSTDLTLVLHLPPGVQPEEPRYHLPRSWTGADAPITGIDSQGRVTYTWNSPDASASSQYTFGASFPASYIPAAAIVRQSFLDSLNIDFDSIIGSLICCGFAFFMFGMPIISIIGGQRRKLQYLPPKIAIEGHGIKRGLTAVEAAILMQEPLDKVMTMILFGTLKKDAAEVIKRDPLDLKVATVLPEDLHEYERNFLAAFKEEKKSDQRRELQAMTVKLVRSVGDKMKGFSRRETIDYYKSIMERAWQQVESADTPEVKSKMFDEALEWTMLDKDFDDRTRRTFTGPVYAPMWWGRYDPTWSGTGGGMAAPSIPGTPGGQGGLPGSAFAASMVQGMQNMSSSVIGNLNSFTNGVTSVTNPPPPPSRSSGGSRSGGGCACACACAGCACACAGGGR